MDKKEEKSGLELMAEDLKQIKESLERLSKTGINRELIELYISRDAKIPITKVREVLDSQKKFFEEAI